MKKRQFTSLILAMSVCFSLLMVGHPTALAAQEGLENFKKVNTYTEGKFEDVSAGDWYHDNVKYVYEIGLMKGNSATSFNANGDVTIAEAVAMACRLHNIYHTGKEDFQQGSPWYQCYVDYAKKYNLLPEEYTDYTVPISRIPFAQILYGSVPKGALAKINDVEDNAIKNIMPLAPYHDAVYGLYEAGVVTGTEDPSDFNGWASIRRSEASAIISRIADESLRKHFTIKRTIPHYAEEPLAPDFGEICKTLLFNKTSSGLSHTFIYKREWFDTYFLDDWRNVLDKEGFSLVRGETRDGGFANVFQKGDLTLKEGVSQDIYYVVEISHNENPSTQQPDPSEPDTPDIPNTPVQPDVPSEPGNETITTIDDMEKYLNENFSYVSTPLTYRPVTITISENDSSMFLYDLEVRSTDPVSWYDLKYSIKYTDQEKKETIRILREHQKSIYEAVSHYFPDKKIAGGFYEGYYRYPNIKVDYVSYRALSWMNYTPSKFTGFPDADYYSSEITDFHWVNTYDDYKFED